MVKIEPHFTHTKGINAGSDTILRKKNSFQNVLSELQTQGAGKVNSSPPVGNTESILPTRDSTHPVLNHAETILNSLEQYRMDLLDPSKTLKDLDRTLKRIDHQVDRLKRRFPVLSPSLERLVEQVSTTAEVERIKFERGDYLD